MARKRVLLLLVAALAIAGASVAVAQASTGGRSHRHDGDRGGGGQGGGSRTATPIKHVVVIFQENVSFDHYFGTYPNAANTDGQPSSRAGDAGGRRAAAGDEHFAAAEPPPLAQPADEQSRTPPRRSGSTASATGATARHGAAHLRPGSRLQRRAAGVRRRPDGPLRPDRRHRERQHEPVRHARAWPRTVMDYYDGNAVTALWNYAQHFAMSDNSFGTTFGPSAPGAINLISGDTGNVDTTHTGQQPVDLDLDLARTPTSRRTATAATR